MNWSEIASSQLPTLSSGPFSVIGKEINPASVRSENNVSNSIPLRSKTSSKWDGSASITRPAELEDNQEDWTMSDAKFETLDDMLTRQENEIVKSVLTDSAYNTRRNIDNFIEKKLQVAWEREREIWIQDIIGTRYLGGSGNHWNESNLVMRQNFQPPSKAESEKVNYSVDMSNINFPEASEMDLVRRHLEVIKSLSPTTSRDSDVKFRFRSFVDQLGIAFRQGNYRQGQGKAYLSSLELLSELVSIAWHSSSTEQARACLSYLSKQFRAFVRGTVSNMQDAIQGDASVQESMVYKSVLASQYHIFARRQLVAGATEDQLLWATLFYCLRSGDAVAAAEVLRTDQTLSNNQNAPVARMIRTMAHAQGSCDCLWNGSVPILSSDDMIAVENLCANSPSTDSNQIFQIGVYTLLARNGQPKVSGNVAGFRSIEDYLTFFLFSSMLQVNPDDGLIRIRNLIADEFGEQYFQDQTSDGWSFAIPLLLTQQYKRALKHLYEKGGRVGLLFTSHMGLILGYSGIINGNMQSHVEQNVVDDDIVSSLLIDYANCLLSDTNFGPLAAFEYLVRIPNRARALHEVSSLIAMTVVIQNIAGTLDHEGKRQNSVLDQYLDENEIEKVLCDSANILRAQTDDRNKHVSAVRCLMLAGNYRDVLMIFNELLSPPTARDHNRDFWVEQVNSFHEVFLSKRTHVLATLTRNGRSSLIETNRMLLKINQFAKLLSVQQLDEAWEIANGLGILPTTQGEVTTKVSLFREMDDALKSAVPIFMSGYVDILLKRISQTKREFQGNSNAITLSLLNKLKEQGGCLVTFSSLLGIPDDGSKIAQLLQL